MVENPAPEVETGVEPPSAQTPLKSLAARFLKGGTEGETQVEPAFNPGPPDPPENNPVFPPRFQASEQAGISRFRSWWWEIFDCGADSAEFNAKTPEAARELLPILRNLVWPDFSVQVEGTILRLERKCERHYRRQDVANEGGATPERSGDFNVNQRMT